MSNDDASVPSRVYSSVSPLSAGVAVTGAPTSTPAALFSGTARVAVVPEKTGDVAADRLAQSQRDRSLSEVQSRPGLDHS